MSMTIDHALGVVDDLVRQTSDLQEAVQRAAQALEMAEELKLQSREFIESDADFSRPIVFEAAASQASYIAETLDDGEFSLAARALEELAEILKLGEGHLRIEAENCVEGGVHA